MVTSPQCGRPDDAPHRRANLERPRWSGNLAQFRWMTPANRVENSGLSRGRGEQIPAPAKTFGSHPSY